MLISAMRGWRGGVKNVHVELPEMKSWLRAWYFSASIQWQFIIQRNNVLIFGEEKKKNGKRKAKQIIGRKKTLSTVSSCASLVRVYIILIYAERDVIITHVRDGVQRRLYRLHWVTFPLGRILKLYVLMAVKHRRPGVELQRRRTSGKRTGVSN